MAKAKPKPEEIEELVQKTNEEVYGEESISGSMSKPDSDDNAEKPLEEYIGNEPSEELNVAQEIEKDEEGL